MKFLLDMGLAQSTAAFLRSQGHNAVHLREQGLQRMQDEDIIRKAIEEDRVILTHDLDFGRIVALSRESLPSVVTFHLQDMRATNEIDFCQRFSLSFPVNWNGVHCLA